MINRCLFAIVMSSATLLWSADFKESYAEAQRCCKNKEYDKAIDLYKKIIELDPGQEHAYVELARLFCDRGDFAKSCDYLLIQQARGLPKQLDDAFAYANLLLATGAVDDAFNAYVQLHQRNPKSVSITYNLAYIGKMVIGADFCINILEQIVDQNPEYEEAQFSLGHSYLAGGYWQKGWRQHDRFLRRSHRYTPDLRVWIEQGSLAGKYVVVKLEGGFGDTIQFCRCAAWLKARGANVTAIVQKPLINLLMRCPFIDQVLSPGNSVSRCDAITTFMTIPALFEADEAMMSSGIPYIFPDPDLEHYWAERMEQDKNVKIGICWQADVHNDESRLLIARRGVPLANLLSIANVPGITLYSLQCKDGLDELDDQARAIIHSFGDDFDESHGSFMDTAAVMKKLDLVISVDSAVAHLAGAMGVPVWLLLPYSTDWRWIIGRTDSPWYPSMCIFKQPAPFDWSSVINEVEGALRNLVSSCNHS